MNLEKVMIYIDFYRIMTGSKEVGGSTPPCSTQIINELQNLFVAHFLFLPRFCQVVVKIWVISN